MSVKNPVANAWRTLSTAMVAWKLADKAKNVNVIHERYHPSVASNTGRRASVLLATQSSRVTYSVSFGDAIVRPSDVLTATVATQRPVCARAHTRLAHHTKDALLNRQTDSL